MKRPSLFQTATPAPSASAVYVNLNGLAKDVSNKSRAAEDAEEDDEVR